MLGSNLLENHKDCYDVQKSGSKTSGVYTVYPPGEGSGVQVYCNMDVDGGGWLVIQKRDNGHVDFYRTYSEYEAGFGNKSDEHWLGNRYIHEITSSGEYELLVILEDFQKHVKTAHYNHFQVGSATESYKLDVSGYNGTAGDSLIFDHNGKPFSTHDADHDSASSNCAQVHHGGYWYSSCFKSNINGQWGKADATGITWGSYENWRMYVLKHTEMLIRPVHKS
ncbi:hypothetical protein CHS0354_030781 [Potamilus streckersoni]|uniref:Fibrinogen C-terminal domain-containing protein n=1 Tax=Potamilus streckersoni TaxID=2493646 RepID=A0AAE0TEB2_9BIVA|nr:hypothetical protein CHS0354_030781 [Potamilus streckersoni]